MMCGALLKAGANVIIWSRTQASVDQALAKLTENSSTRERLAGFRVDTGNESEVTGGLQHALRTFAAPEILVNAVGGVVGKAPLVETDVKQFEQTLHLNLVAGLLITTKVVAAYWIENDIKGSIINLTSMASYNPLSGVLGYDAAKAGVLNLTMAAAKELAPHHIRVNAIAPGFFLGKQNRALLVDEETGQYTERGKAVIAHTPFGRFGKVEELMGVTLFLASTRASGFITGVSIPVDGGYLAHNI
jgi:NAD(P)-dependent dehydrogenase (short-subunit alcohol dehydrogenase family)